MKKFERKDRNEKRRLQLSKRPAEGEVAAKTLDMNKRAIAFFIAFAMILAMLPAGIVMHVRADSEDQLDPVTMWVRMNGVDNWDEVTMNPGKISDNIGAVEVDNMPDGAEFVKALIIDHDTGIETEIKSLGAIGDDYYYSLNDETNAGTKLDKSHEELILVYGNRYRITENKTGSGDGTYEIVAHTDDQGKYLWAKEDLVIQKIEPAQDSKIDGVSFRSGASNGTVEIKDGAATIPYNKIKGDITVNLQFDAVDAYSITEGNVAQGDICQELGVADYHQTTYDSQEVDGVAPGETATFYVFSQSWTGGDAWILNQLTLNGENINLPLTDDINSYPNNQGDTLINNGPSAETELANGSIVTVQLVAKGRGMFWKTGDADYHEWGIAGEPGTFDKWEKYRCIYEVTITDVHEDYVVDGNFKDSSKREIIVKGLEGIDKTAAAEEDIRLISGFRVMQRYYTFTSNAKNIYTANYTRPIFSESVYPSDNLILYTVKYGYNPYSVSTAVAYGNGEASEDSVRDATRAGKPVEVIQKAKTLDYDDDSTGRYDTSFRHWGKNSVLQNQESTYRPSFEWGSKDLLLTTVSKDTTNDWYAVALAQNAAKDQQLYLNASPYNFRLQLDVTGGEFDLNAISFADDRFTGDLTAYLETDGHTVVGSAPYTYLPDAEPTMDKYAFEYWQLTDAEGNPIEATRTLKTQYQPMDRLTLSEEMVNTVIALNETEDDDKYDNDKTIYLKAVWAEVQESTKTKVEIASFTQVAPATEGTDANPVSTADNKTYRRDYHQIETQNVGPVALLNMHQPANSEYYVLNEGLSKLKTNAEVVDVEDDEIVIPQDTNLLTLYYDYKTISLELKKEVKGKPKTREYTIALTLTKPAESPVSVAEALEMMGLSTSSEGVTTTDDSITIVKSYGKNSSISFDNVPYNWSYRVLEDVTDDDTDYTSDNYDQSGYLTDDTVLTVTNTGNNPGIEVDKKLSYDAEYDSYSIDLAAYSTGETYTEQLDSNVPLDIAIVLDQSGSMAERDVTGYTQSKTGGENRLSWSVNDATGHYYKVGTKYYPVTTLSQYQYDNLGKLNLAQLLPSTDSQHTSWYYSDTGYYAKEDDAYYPLFYRTRGSVVGTGDAQIFSWVVEFFYVEDSSISTPSEAAYNNNNRHLVKMDGQTTDGFAYRRDPGWDFPFLGMGAISSSYRNATIEIPLYSRTTVYSIGYERNGTSYEIPFTSYNSSKSATITTETPLFEKTTSTRLDALKQSVSTFVEEVARQASENNVDHKVAIIGFANNEQPDASTTKDRIIGESEYITTNTGIFVDGEFKNYMTPILPGETAVSTNDFRASISSRTQSHGGVFGIGAHDDYYYTYSTNTNPYTNLTFFTNDGYPIRYDSASLLTRYCPNNSSNYEYGNQSTYFYLSPDSNTREYSWSSYIWKGYNGTSSSYTAPQPYYPEMVALSEEDYQGALEIVQENGSINSDITNAINQVNAYGGTYLPYGLAMANNVFKYNAANDSDGTQRKRVVLVFTDGEPGGSGYEQTIANEALATADIAKEEYGASVYTIGLYPTDTTNQVNTFMHQLSSEYYASTENVFEENNGISSNGKYYFTDENGRVHALTSYRNTSNVSFTDTKIGDRTIPVTSDSGGAHNQTTWKDSDGWVRAAYWDEAEAENPTRSNFYQFFTIGESKATGSDNYYYSAADTPELVSIFETISTQLQHPTTTVKLDAYSSFMKDGISDNFDYSNASVTLQTYDAGERDLEQAVTVDRIKNDFHPSNTSAEGATFEWESNYLKVNGFDYSKYYIGEDHDGKIIVATITGLKLKEGVYGNQIPSNTTDSGVYKKDGDTSRMVAEFPQQYASAGTYSATVKLDYIGERAIQGQKFNVDLKLTMSDGETPYTGNIGGTTFSEKGTFSTKLGDDQSKQISGIPKDAILTVTVSDPDSANTYYTYLITDTINNGEDDIRTTISDPTDPRTGNLSITEDHPNILISVNDTRQPFTVTNHTQGQPGEADYSDKTKKFDITLTLYKNGENAPVSGEVALIDQSGESVVFENGTYTAKLADNESLALFVPEGYSVKVEDEGTFNYSATYQMDADTIDSNPRTAVFNAESRENGHAVDVYHTVNSVVISGIMDKVGKLNPFLVAAVIATALGGSWLAYLAKKRKENSAQ